MPDALVRVLLAAGARDVVSCLVVCAATIIGDVMRATTNTVSAPATVLPMSASVRFAAGPTLSGLCEFAEETWSGTAS
jgi:hypothetical protein